MHDMSCSQFSAVGSRFISSSSLWIISVGVVLLYVGSKLGSNLHSEDFKRLLQQKQKKKKKNAAVNFSGIISCTHNVNVNGW